MNNMLNLIFRRIVLAFVIAFLCYILIYFSAFLFIVLRNVVTTTELIRRVFTYSICIFGSVALIFDLKLHNKTVQNKYTEHLHTVEPNFKMNCLFVLKSKEHLASCIILNCIAIPLGISVGLQQQFPALSLVAGTLLIVLVLNLCFTLLNCLLWHIVFVLWNHKAQKETLSAI